MKKYYDLKIKNDLYERYKKISRHRIAYFDLKYFKNINNRSWLIDTNNNNYTHYSYKSLFDLFNFYDVEELIKDYERLL